MRRLAYPLTLLAVVAVVSPRAAAAAAIPTASATLAQAGLGPLQSADSAGGPHQILLPVDPRLVPTRLTGRFGLLGDRGVTGRVLVTLRSRGRLIGRYELSHGHATQPFSVALPAPAAGASSSQITMSVADATARRCTGGGIVQLSRARATYSGPGRTPTSVAQSMPSILQRLHVVVPNRPDAAHALAAVTLATAIAGRYASQPVAIDVVGAAREGAVRAAADPSPFERTIVIRDGAPGVRLSSLPGQRRPAVVVSGGPRQIAAQASAAIDQMALFARMTQATGLPLAAPIELPATVKTVGDLGALALRTDGVGALAVTVPFSQSDLGGPVQSVALRLRGSVSALQPRGRSSLQAEVNGEVLQTWRLQDGADFEHVLQVPASVLHRDNVLTVLGSYAPPGHCGVGDVPVTLAVDSSSSLTSRFGLGPTAGFDDLPQALLPSFAVAFTKADVPSTRSAVALGVLLQRKSRRPLAPHLASVRSALLATGPALIVGPGAMDLDSLPPAGRRLAKRLGPGPFGAVTVVRDQDRALVLASWRGGDAGLLSGLLHTLGAQPGGLDALGTSRAAVQAPGDAVELLPAGADGAPRPVAGDGRGHTVLIGGIIGGALLTLLAAAWAFNRRFW